MYIYIYICVYIYLYMHIHTYMYMHVCTPICVQALVIFQHAQAATVSFDHFSIYMYIYIICRSLSLSLYFVKHLSIYIYIHTIYIYICKCVHLFVCKHMLRACACKRLALLSAPTGALVCLTVCARAHMNETRRKTASLEAASWKERVREWVKD